MKRLLRSNKRRLLIQQLEEIRQIRESLEVIEPAILNEIKVIDKLDLQNDYKVFRTMNEAFGPYSRLTIER